MTPQDLGPPRELVGDDEIAALVRSAKRVAVLGIKPESEAEKPAHYVPAYLARHGVEVVPVPVGYFEALAILGARVHHAVAEVPGPIDIVDVFRRSADVERHADDLVAAKPRAVWLQSGIRDDRTAARLIAAGIFVVQDRCLMVEHRRAAAP